MDDFIARLRLARKEKRGARMTPDEVSLVLRLLGYGPEANDFYERTSIGKLYESRRDCRPRAAARGAA